MKTWMLRNSSGKPDATLTFAVIGFSTVMLKVMANGAVLFGHQLGTIDAGVVAAVLTPTLGAYVIRRGQTAGTDTKDRG